MLKIFIVGLCLLAKNEQGSRTVILPDVHRSVTVMTPRGAAVIEPHVSYIAAAASDGDNCFACVKTDKEWRLDLNGDNVTIAGIKCGYLEDQSFEDDVPQMASVCKAFELSIPISASTFVITGGKLFSNRSEKDRVRESRIEAEKIEGQMIVITATRNGITRIMMLKSTTTQIKIANRYVNHRHDNMLPLADNHWLAFYTLSATPVVCDLPAVTERRWETTSACSNSGYP